MVWHDRELTGSWMLQRNEVQPYRAGRTALGGLPGLVLGLLAAGCGDRYQLGETAHTLDGPVDSPGLDALAVLIVNKAEDTDGSTTHASRFSQSVGDVDGDGYDDWANSSG